MIAEMISRGTRQLLSGLNPPDKWLTDWASGGEETSSGEYINEQNALNCPTVKAAVSFLSEAFAVAKVEVCERQGEKVQVVNDHPVSELLNREPNPETSDGTWWDAMQNGHGLWGNAYAEIQGTLRGNRVFALWNRSSKPERTKPVRSRDDDRLYYECHDANGRLEGHVPAANMLHVRYMSLDGILGKSPIRMIRESVGGSRAAERFANEVFRNGDAAAGYFTHPGKLTEPAYNRLKKSLGEKSGHGERHQKHVLEEGMLFKETSYKPSDLQLIEAREYLDLVIARAYNIDAQLLQMRAAGSLNFTDLLRKLATVTLQFWGKRWTSEIDAKLLKPPYFARWNFNAFLFSDRLAMSQEHRTNFSTGKQSVNEMRHERGDNRLDDPMADEHFVPMNMVPLSMAAEFAKATIAKAKAPTSNPIGGDNSEAPPGMPSGGGDGKQPGDAGGQPGGRPPSDGGQAGDLASACAQAPDISREIQNGPLALLEAEALLAETLRRFERIEANAALRAAKFPPEFQAKLDEFYGKHVERMREELLQPVRLVVLLRDGQHGSGISADIELDNTINEHVGGKRDALLAAAADCPAQDLPARVATVVEAWGHAST